jgi:hypothetical protein
MGAIEIQFEFNSQELGVFRDRKVERALGRALSMAGGDGIRAMRAKGKQRVRERKSIKAAYLSNRALPLSFPSGKDIDGMVWVMGVSGKEIPLAKYPARQTKRGVSVLVNKGKRKLVRHAFLATMKSGHTGVWFREGKKRLPIKHALSSRVSDVFHDAGMVATVQARGLEVMSGAFRRLFPIELAKVK